MIFHCIYCIIFCKYCGFGMKKFYEEVRDIERSVSCNLYKNGFVEIHYHESVEIIAVKKGCITLIIGGNSYELNEGEIGFVPSFFPHSIKKQNENEYYAIIISKPYLKDYNSSFSNAYWGKLGNSIFNKKIFDAIEFFKCDNNKILLQGVTDVILGLIVSQYTNQETSGNNNSLVRNIIEYIDINYAEDISLTTLAEHFGYSKYYFSAFFNKNFGCNLNTYLNNVRINKIENESGSKTEKILNSGFKTLSTYYRTLAKYNKK